MISFEGVSPSEEAAARAILGRMVPDLDEGLAISVARLPDWKVTVSRAPAPGPSILPDELRQSVYEDLAYALEAALIAGLGR